MNLNPEKPQKTHQDDCKYTNPNTLIALAPNSRTGNPIRRLIQMYRNVQKPTFTLFIAALLVGLALSSCLADQQQQQQKQAILAPGPAQVPRHSLLATKLLPQQTKARSARSLSDMFERVKSRIFGSKKQAASQSSAAASSTSSQIQPAASAVNSAVQRQPWDVSVKRATRSI